MRNPGIGLTNRLINALPATGRATFLANCRSVDLTIGDVLYQAGAPRGHAYFPTAGFLSLETSVGGSPAIEVGLTGREGMIGVELALDMSTSPVLVVVRDTGEALRITTSALRVQLAANTSLRRVINRYAWVVMSQLTGSSACLRFHTIAQRLARWILMTQDRTVAGDDLQVTHEFLASMLGVRRAGITEAAGTLAESHLIRYHRGSMTIIDRPGLELASCACYASDRAAYRSVFAFRKSASTATTQAGHDILP